MAAASLQARNVIRRRRKYEEAQAGPLANTGTSPRAAGTAAAIPDGGAVPPHELMGALREVDAPEVNADGEDDEVSAHGLKLLEGGGDTQRPQVMHGTRAGGQVFIRQGLVGDSLTPGLRLRRMRSITVVRVEAPVFEGRYADGRIVLGDEAPPALRDSLESLQVVPEVWHEARLVSGAKGIAVSRAASNDFLGGWIYDLWLLEAIARRTDSPALKPIRLNRGWKAPYGLHDWAPGLMERE